MELALYTSTGIIIAALAGIWWDINKEENNKHPGRFLIFWIIVEALGWMAGLILYVISKSMIVPN